MRLLETYNGSSQTATVGSAINLGSLDHRINCCGTFTFSGSETISLNVQGYYEITFVANVVALDDNSVGIQMYANNSAVNGAISTTTFSATSNTATLTFSKIIRVLPNCCSVVTNVPTNLTFIPTTNNYTISNVNVIVTKVN